MLQDQRIHPEFWQAPNPKTWRCKGRKVGKACARDMCAGRCDVTNTERSPETLPQTQKPSRISFSFSFLFFSSCLGQRQLLPAFEARSSLFSGGLGCQMLQGAWYNGAWCISFCLLLQHYQNYFRTGLVARCFRVLGATVLGAKVLRQAHGRLTEGLR